MNPKIVFEWDGESYRMRTESLPGITMAQQEKLLAAVNALNGWEASAQQVGVHVDAVHLQLIEPE